MSVETVETILRQGRSHLEGLGAEVALVMLLNEGKLVIRKASGVESQDLSARTPLFDLVTGKNTSILVLDTVQDRRFESLPDEVRSVLCVPIEDEGKTLGLLYGEASRPGVFSHKAQEDTARFARSLGGKLQQAREHEARRTAASPTDQPTPEETAAAGRQLILPVVLMMAALLWPLVQGQFASPVASPTPTPAKPGLTAETDPALTVRSFLLLLQFQKFDQAYELFSPEQRRRLSREEFSERARRWLEDGSQTEELTQREAILEQRRSQTAVVLVKPSGGGGQTWTWKLARQQQSWFIDECRGTPLSPL